MNLLSPESLWFAATIPAVIVLYLLKRKRVVRLVSSTLLWQRFLAESQASAPFQKLRRNWLLLLQILLLALAVIALCRPYFSGNLMEKHLHVVILDASASMQSRDEEPSRFEKARREALNLIDTLRDTDQMIILLAAANTEVKQSTTSEKASLRRALLSCEVTDATTRLTEALKMAESLTRDNSQAEVHLFSDGAAPGMDELESKGINLVYHRVGQDAENLGIIKLDSRPNPENPQERAVFVTVANAGASPQNTEIELDFEGQLVEARSLSLLPTNTASVVFVVSQPYDGVFTARITADDAMPADNQASVVSRLPQPARILLVTPGNRFLEKALRASGTVDLRISPTLTQPDPKFDLVVLDTPNPVTWPSLNVLAFRTPDARGLPVVGTLQNPPIVDWRITHPVLRFVTFDNVQIARAEEITPPPWAIPLVESPQAPLIIAGELGRQRIVWLGFDALESTWPLRVSFPIFIANAVHWLNPRTIETERLLVQAGTPFRLPLTEPTSEATVEHPDGTRHSVPIDPAAAELVYGRTEQTGTYQISLGTNTVSFCVNLLDPMETDTRPREEITMGRFGTVTATTRQRANLELWRWIAAAALAVLLFEWWYYHRRTA